MNAISRAGRGLVLGLALVLSTPTPSPAQEEPGMPIPVQGEGGEQEGKPLFGYLACGAGCIAIMFIICISARR